MVGSNTPHANPAAWIALNAELNWTIYAQMRLSGSKPACWRGPLAPPAEEKEMRKEKEKIKNKKEIS